jgi:hypothetical protein
MKYDVSMSKEATQTEKTCSARVNRLRRTATALALVAFVLSLGCQVSDSSEDGDDGGGAGSEGSSGEDASGGSSEASAGSSGALGTAGSAGAPGSSGEPGGGGAGGDPGVGGTGGDSGTAGTGGDPGVGGTGGSCDAAFADSHWTTPSCPSSVCYDTLLSSDGTYRKQRIVITGGNVTLFCEHGTWQMLDCATLDFVPCKGDPYQQSWSHSPGVFELQGVGYVEDSSGIFNCGPNDC